MEVWKSDSATATRHSALPPPLLPLSLPLPRGARSPPDKLQAYCGLLRTIADCCGLLRPFAHFAACGWRGGVRQHASAGTRARTLTHPTPKANSHHAHAFTRARTHAPTLAPAVLVAACCGLLRLLAQIARLVPSSWKGREPPLLQFIAGYCGLSRLIAACCGLLRLLAQAALICGKRCIPRAARGPFAAR